MFLLKGCFDTLVVHYIWIGGQFFYQCSALFCRIGIPYRLLRLGLSFVAQFVKSEHNVALRECGLPLYYHESNKWNVKIS